MTPTESPHPQRTKGNYILPLTDTVIYPKTRTKILVDKETGEYLVRETNRAGYSYPIGLTVKNGTDPAEISEDKLFSCGNLLEISSIHQTEDGYLLEVQAIARVRIEEISVDNGQMYAMYSPVPDMQDLDDAGHREMLIGMRKVIHEISSNFQGSEQFTGPLDRMESVDQIIGFTMPYIPVSLEKKQELLEIVSLRGRYRMFLEILEEFRDTLSLRIEMSRKVTEKVTKSNREAMLREQLRVIQEELGEIDGSDPGDDRYREKIQESKMPEEVRKKALSDLKKLESGGNQSHESPVIRNYLDLLLDLPWAADTVGDIDIARTRSILDKNHYGLSKVKERIIQHLAVMKLKKERQGSLLLLVGPPGTGKTSLGRSIAEALGREYVRVSLGGIKDEAEIRGHRRTYVGALPGRIIQGIRRAGTKNPVFVLDEIDKLAFSYNGDPASALLEVLDPEQNSSFSDHYLEVPYDLSEVLFIATANSTATIPAPLLDRMELIEIPGYTKNETFAIGRDHLLPKTLEEHGLDGDKLILEEDALVLIIEKYTWEAGVRGLKKQLNQVARYVSEKIVSGTMDLPCIVKPRMIAEILGKEVFRHEIARKALAPGVATGLAWTPAGGDILFIEATFMPGSGKLTLTGQLGEVMKESANISMSLIRSRFAYTATHIDFLTSDVHIHVPSGATPKDGPSAGITLLTALVSLITGKNADPKLAMTGEVTLSGAVLPVGGIREKILAAHRAGITKVILPKENERDLDEIPGEVRNELSFVLVEEIEEVLKEALGIDLPAPVLAHKESHMVIATEP